MRLNIAGLAVFRLRSAIDLENILIEYSALGIDKKTLNRMYQIATQEQYSFLYVNLLARDTSEMFFKRFEARLIPNTTQE